MPDEGTKRKQFAVQHEEQAKAQVQQEAKRAKKLALREKLQLSQDVLAKTCDVCGAENINTQHTALVCQEQCDTTKRRLESCRAHDKARTLGKDYLASTLCWSWHFNSY